MTEAEIKAMQEQLAAEKKARIEADAKTKAAEDKASAAESAAASFAEKAALDRKAGFVSFAEAQVTAGKLLPKDKHMAVETLVALDAAKPVEFSEGDTTRKISPGQWLQDLIANAKPAVNFGEFAGGNGATQVQPGAAQGKSDDEVDKAAKAYATQHKVDYSEALRAVTATFTSAA